MPRGFTPQEREVILEKLMDAGRFCIEKFGIRKTTVEDLTRDAGISKGAFYKFFDSKEELLFQVLERFEAIYRLEIKHRMKSYNDLPHKEQVRRLLSDSFSLYWKHPMFRFLNPEEYEVLFRKLPPEIVKEHLESDDVFVAELIELWEENGMRINGDAKSVSALVKSLFYTSLHAEEIGTGFPAAFETLINLVSDHLVIE